MDRRRGRNAGFDRPLSEFWVAVGVGRGHDGGDGPTVPSSCRSLPEGLPNHARSPSSLATPGRHRGVRRARIRSVSRGASVAVLVLVLATAGSVAGIVTSNHHHGVATAAAAIVSSTGSDSGAAVSGDQFRRWRERGSGVHHCDHPQPGAAHRGHLHPHLAGPARGGPGAARPQGGGRSDPVAGLAGLPPRRGRVGMQAAVVPAGRHRQDRIRPRPLPGRALRRERDRPSGDLRPADRLRPGDGADAVHPADVGVLRHGRQRRRRGRSRRTSSTRPRPPRSYLCNAGGPTCPGWPRSAGPSSPTTTSTPTWPTCSPSPRPTSTAGPRTACRWCRSRTRSRPPPRPRPPPPDPRTRQRNVGHRLDLPRSTTTRTTSSATSDHSRDIDHPDDVATPTGSPTPHRARPPASPTMTPTSQPAPRDDRPTATTAPTTTTSTTTASTAPSAIGHRSSSPSSTVRRRPARSARPRPQPQPQRPLRHRRQRRRGSPTTCPSAHHAVCDDSYTLTRPVHPDDRALADDP